MIDNDLNTRITLLRLHAYSVSYTFTEVMKILLFIAIENLRGEKKLRLQYFIVLNTDIFAYMCDFIAGKCLVGLVPKVKQEVIEVDMDK